MNVRIINNGASSSENLDGRGDGGENEDGEINDPTLRLMLVVLFYDFLKSFHFFSVLIFTFISSSPLLVSLS